MKKLNLQGTFTALVTPFKKDSSVDFETISKLIDLQIEGGVEGIVVCGSTGESATLSHKEKQAIIVHSVEYSAGRIPIIAGTGTNETDNTKALTLIAKEHGADAALIVTPYYNKPPQEGIFEHFRLIAESVDIPIILYNVPGRTATNMNAETQLRLAESCSNIVATKEASGDMNQIMQIIKNAPADFSVLSGDDSVTVPLISVGAKGIISVLSNYAPKQFSECIRLALKGKFKEAQKIHYSLFELMQLNFIEPNPIPVKYIMSLMGLVKEYYRLPLYPLKPESKKKIKQALKDTGFIR
jgi:4-hydroxy-tetrahydrodipicolinate synthase